MTLFPADPTTSLLVVNLLLIVRVGIRPDDQSVGVWLWVDDHIVRVDNVVIVIPYIEVSFLKNSSMSSHFCSYLE